MKRILVFYPRTSNLFLKWNVTVSCSEKSLSLGWRDSLLNLPKKWLSGTSLVHHYTTSANKEKPPKLPLPPLEQTLKKYQQHLRPLLDDQEFERVKKIVEKFGAENGHGQKLQCYLEERRKKLDNWAYEYWLNDMYLHQRAALPVFSNPGQVFQSRKFTTVLDLARFTARLLDCILDHKAILDKGAYPVEKLPNGQEMCMRQFYCVLGACRIPGKCLDTQYTALSENKNCPNEHVIILCRNVFYCVPLIAPDRGRLSEDEICAQVMYILEHAPTVQDPPPVGILTGWTRTEWAEARERLMRDECNCRNLELLVKSIVVICLDESLPTSFNATITRGAKGITAGCRDETNIMHQVVHGGGCNHNSGNRWFDKTLQLIIANDGGFGLCYEHSQAEGVAVILMMDDIIKKIDSLPPNCDVPQVCHLPPPEPLEWNLEANDLKNIESAATHVGKLAKDFDYYTFRFNGYGKDFIKVAKCSPDAYIQLALQLSYYKCCGKLTATYESCAVRRFLHGRVDVIRSASMEALNWARAMAQPKDDDTCNKKVTFHLVSDEEKLELWKKAIAQQTAEMKANVSGHGIDTHILGLREAAKETSPTAASELPEIFTDKSYRILNTFLLTTSQTTTKSNSFMGYGAVEPDGYAASYNIKNDYILFCLASYHSSEVTSTAKFCQSLEESLCSMQALLSRPAS